MSGKNPPIKSISTQGKYREQYGVIVICHDERDQEMVYNRLKAIGRPLKVVAT